MAEPRQHEHTVYISRMTLRDIKEHFHHTSPYEACGILLGEAAAGGMHIRSFEPMRNVAPDPLHHFSADPGQWVHHVLHSRNMIGIIHSHPSGGLNPSSEDLAALQHIGELLKLYGIGCVHPDSGHLDCSLFRIDRESRSAPFKLTPVSLSLT
ncbi:Mov34/MPN/PAD-1 family protein [Paenibacillus sp. JX-17]|uniref:Mov34/MPN/PAD-1 family protein n=1 Tax=Paenibacillus lacisoli TaxID=3064525 RepID=A0ABT9C9R9_9BACL|nr:Mov34/MPN/PAD-1 family protein [Paenibacillus sp. JX-17]MDO7906002.1 Mov34/MPN/PAD-1 family protein [Paenibacillus sp. JX-17]